MSEDEILLTRREWNYDDEEIEPLEGGYSSTEVIAAAEELKFKQLQSDHRIKSIAQQFAIPVHRFNHTELETQYSTSLKYGLHYNQVQKLNKLYPLPNSRFLSEVLNNFNIWGECISIILLVIIIIICIENNRSIIIFITIQIALMFISTVLLILPLYIRNNLFKWQYSILQKIMKQKPIPVIRHIPQSKKMSLIEGFASKHDRKYVHSDVLALIIQYCSAESMIDVEDLVPGDIIKIEEGDMIPADLRVIECTYSFEVDQYDLTGLHSKWKNCRISDDTIDGARNICFYSSICTKGEAKCMVFEVGKHMLYYKANAVHSNNKHNLWSIILVSICFVYLILIVLEIDNIINYHIAYIVSIIWFCVATILIVIILIGAIIELSFAKTKNKLQSMLKDQCNIFCQRNSAQMLGFIHVLFLNYEDESIDEINEKLCNMINDLAIKVIFIRRHKHKTSNSSSSLQEVLNFIEDSQDFEFGKRHSDNEYILEISVYDSDILEDIVLDLKGKGYKVGVVGNSFDHCQCLKSANSGICINAYAEIALKRVADVICLDSDRPLECIVKSIKISQDFMKSVVTVDSRFDCFRLFSMMTT